MTETEIVTAETSGEGRSAPTELRATKPWEPLGWALADYLAGDRRSLARVWMEDGEALPLIPGIFFRSPDELPDAECTALDLCRGRVLDLGAGAGCHSLELQSRGLDVTALDVSPRSVGVMNERGVARAICGGLDHDWGGDRFDSLLLLMNGLGIVGDCEGLARFLGTARGLLRPGGQILCDSSDLGRIKDPDERRRGDTREQLGRHRGETIQRIEYHDLLGDPFGWLYLGADDLARQAEAAGFHCQVVFEEDEGIYLARLTAF